MTPSASTERYKNHRFPSEIIKELSQNNFSKFTLLW